MPRILVLLVLGACSAPTPTTVTLRGAGFRVVLAPAPFSLSIIGDDGVMRLATRGGVRTTFDAFNVEPQIVPGWDGFRSHERAWRRLDTARLEASDSTSATLVFDDASAGPVRVKVRVDGSRVRYEQTAEPTGLLNTSAISFALDPEDHFFGMGQRTATLDHRGTSLYSWPEEGGLGTGEAKGAMPVGPYPNGPSMTYFPVPFVHTTRGVSVWADTFRRSTFDFGTVQEESDTWRIRVLDRSLNLVFYVRDRPLDAIDDFTSDTGRPLIPPAWAYGPRRRINMETRLEGQPEWKLMRDRKLPLTGVDDALHFLPANSHVGSEAERAAWTQELHANGFKVLAYNNPYVSASSPKIATEFQFGVTNGLFEQTNDGGIATTFFLSGGAQTVATIDLTNPRGVAWLQQLLSRTLDAGYDGWMHDFGEYVGHTSRFSNGLTGADEHNHFPVRSAKAAYELLKGTDALCFLRSGYTGSQAYAFEVWGGDPEATFDDAVGLPATLRGGLNLSMVGVPYWSSDVGGYKCLTAAPNDKEMLIRWYQMGATSPMMHDEDACSNPVGGDRVKARLWDDVETQDAYRTAASLHTRLAPYFRALAVAAHQTGVPVTRHPFLLFPRAPEAWAVDDAFFIGPSIYAAPVVRRHARSRSVWLPPGRYVDWNERTQYEGDRTVEIPAPLDRLPLFLVENQLVPLLDAEVQTLAPATVPGVVTEASRSTVIDVVGVLGPSGVASFTLADGTTFEARRLSEDSTALCAACSIDASRPVRRLTISGRSRFADVQLSSTFRGAVRWDLYEVN